MWFGLQAGLTYEQAMDLPQSLVLDLLAVDAIERGGAQRKNTGADALTALQEMAKLR